MALPKIPDKYLQLNSAFQQLKCATGKLGIREIDVEGVLTGDSLSLLSLLKVIFFSPTRLRLQTVLSELYGLSPSLSDYKLAETIFRVCRFEFGMTLKLSVEQFLNGGNFTVKKIEFMTDLSNVVARRVGGLKNLKQNSASSSPKAKVVVEDSVKSPPKAFVRPSSSPPKSCPDTISQMKEIHESVSQLVQSVHQLEDRIGLSIEKIEARLQVVEGRLRIWDKLAPSLPTRE